MTDRPLPHLPPQRLADRGVISIAGPDATTFLHNLVCANIERLEIGAATYAALLSPQGKVLFDFFVVRSEDGYLLDTTASETVALVKRLSMYRLRSQVTITDRSTGLAVVVASSHDDLPAGGVIFRDPRHIDLGYRAIGPLASAEALPPAGNDYEQLRIELAIPESGRDFKAGDVVPHDINLDDLNAVDFRKGCYIGQEIVSRMKHRGTARKRLVHVRPKDGDLPEAGTEVLAGARSIGTMGSSSGRIGLAILRLDWVKDAIDSGISITADGTALAVSLPAYARFDFPAASSD